MAKVNNNQLSLLSIRNPCGEKRYNCTMDILNNILLAAIPALVVAGTAYFVLKKSLEKELLRHRQELKLKKHKEPISLIGGLIILINLFLIKVYSKNIV